MKILLVILVSYILGSIPFGYIIAKIKGVDITKLGSGNIGATNVGRNLGKPYFFIVVLFLEKSSLIKIVCGIIAVLIVLRHKSNIERIIKGTEPKFYFFENKGG